MRRSLRRLDAADRQCDTGVTDFLAPAKWIRCGEIRRYIRANAEFKRRVEINCINQHPNVLTMQG